MKKILSFIVLFCLSFTWTSAFNADFSKEYMFDAIESFKDTPDMENYCDQVYIKAYRRRAYTELEKSKCSDHLERKIEEEMIYKQYMLENRGVFY